MVSSTSNALLPALFISHGMPTLAVSKNATTDALARIGLNLPKPKAIVIMSAHWQSQSLAISTASHPQTWHDYVLPKNLPSHILSAQQAHELAALNYPAKGAPLLAQRILDKLHEKNIAAHADNLRPLDHGVWSPLIHMYPLADVAIVQVSLPMHYDAYACYQLGAVLAFLRQEQIMLIGSGSITHNIANISWQLNPTTAQSMLQNNNNSTQQKTLNFKQWMLQTLKHDVPAALAWQTAPFAKENHPTKEHLMPLFFALGSGQRVSLVHASVQMHALGMDIFRFD